MDNLYLLLDESLEYLNESGSKLINKTSKYSALPLTNRSINGINICIHDGTKQEEQLTNLDKDFSICNKEYKNAFKNIFIPWLIKNETKKYEKGELEKNINIEEISYKYGKISSKFSKTGKDEIGGQMSFLCTPNSHLMSNEKWTFDCADFTLYIVNNKLVNVTCEDLS